MEYLPGFQLVISRDLPRPYRVQCRNLTSGDLPREQREIKAIERDVHRACVVIALLHRRHQRRGSRPEHGDASACVQVGPREELTCRQNKLPHQAHPLSAAQQNVWELSLSC